MDWRALLVGLPLFRLAAGAIEAHNYLVVTPTAEPHAMSMIVWVDGQIVCAGTEYIQQSTNLKDWCLRNHDGKGKGCAPGYAFCATDNGREGKLEYFENSVLKQTFHLEFEDWKNWLSPLPCGYTEVGGDVQEYFCSYWESCLSTSDQSSCKLCHEDNSCGSEKDLNPPKTFPYPKPFKAMVIGDSLSHGNEGDFTWRYRIWDWIKDNQEYEVNMVGPWHGTMPRLGPESAKPAPPKIPGEDDYDEDKPNQGGKYHEDVPSSFPDHHFARWGQQVHQSKDLTRDFVQLHSPSHILLMIGFNDIGWFVGDANQVIKDLTELIDHVQRGKGDVQILVATVPHRTKIGGRDDLIEMTDTVNALLWLYASEWSRQDSKVRIVDVAKSYDCSPGGCPDGTDGLHPNPLGEFHIAQAFASVLVDEFGISGDKLKLPDNIPSRSATVPSNFQAKADDIGLKLSWDKVFGVIHYEVRVRLKGQDWSVPHTSSTNAWYRSWVVKGQEWEGQVRSVMADDDKSDWSSTKSAVMNPATLPGPKNLYTKADGDQIKMSWDAVDGPVDRYGVIYYDLDGSEFTQIVGTHKTSYTIDKPNDGHRYTLGVETWGPKGGGWPTIGFDVLAGRGTPEIPGNFKVEAKDKTTVTLSWSASENAAGYRVWIRNLVEGGNLEADPYGSTSETSREIYFLVPGIWNFEFCVSAYNGNSESPRTRIIKGPRP